MLLRKILLMFIICLCSQSNAQLPKIGIENRVRIPVDSLTPSRISTPKLDVNISQRDLTNLGAQAFSGIPSLKGLPGSLDIPTVDGSIFQDVVVEGNWRAVRREWLATVEKSRLEEVKNLRGLSVISVKHLSALGLVLVKLRSEADFDSYSKLRGQVGKLGVGLDRNHIYEVQAAAPEASPPEAAPRGEKLAGEGSGPPCNIDHVNQARVGMLDTAIERNHSTLRKARIIEKDFTPGVTNIPLAHGTAVASLLVGEHEDFKGYVPGATLFAAGVFFMRNQYQDGATTESLLLGLEWLLANDVSIINMSLAGPPNHTLEIALEKAVAAGAIVIAAAGNKGPASPPLYPAAWPSTIAISATDDKNGIYRWANQGRYIDFAARGVAVRAARLPEGLGLENGTSMAAPLASAILASHSRKSQGLHEAREFLRALSVDLPPEGRDGITGDGLLSYACNGRH